MAYSWKILRGAVEQEILFPSEKGYEAYLEQLIRKEEPFEIVDEHENEDGTMTVIMRKRYNNNEFLQREPEFPSDDEIDEIVKSSEFQKQMRLAFLQQAEAIIEEIESDPSYDDVEISPTFREKLMAKIQKIEEKQRCTKVVQ